MTAWPAGSVERKPSIWLAPLNPLPVPFRGASGNPDFFTLFETPAVWEKSRRSVSVFKIYQSLLRDTDDTRLRRMFDFLRSNKIGLALEYGMMTDTDACGRGVEGYFGRYAADSVQRIKSLGGVLAYLDMDEPLWYGLHYDGPRACHRSIADIARDVATHIAEVRSIFPDIQVGDTEPMPQSRAPNWLAENAEWMEAFAKAAGRPLAFFHADVIWTESWEMPVNELLLALNQNHVPAGVIVNGNAGDTTDEAYQIHVEQHITRVENMAGKPDHLLFQSWQANPSRAAPESVPGTMTSLVLQYARRAHDAVYPSR